MKFVGWMGLWGSVGLALWLGGSARAETVPVYGAPMVEGNPQPAVADAQVTADVQARLDEIRVLHAAQVTIVTAGGVVTLAGMVPSQAAHDQAMEATRATPGVLRVNDMMRLNVASPSAPSQN